MMHVYGSQALHLSFYHSWMLYKLWYPWILYKNIYGYLITTVARKVGVLN
jgi:hypothetical protein